MEEFKITVIGAGIVGLAAAAELPSGNNLVVEQYESFGQEASSRNSEVIHAGIHYPPGFLKARLCVSGNEQIYQICRRNNIGHKKSGKIIVATQPDEVERLERIWRQGRANGVSGLEMISGDRVKKMEPAVKAIAGIYSPNTGMVDSHALMRYFEQQAKAKGATFAYGCQLIGLERLTGGYKLSIKDTDGELYNFRTEVLINCAGLGAVAVARMLGINEYRLYYCKGEYFKVSGGKGNRLNRLVYPLPSDLDLGIHTVLDLQGQLKLGPNAFYVDDLDYEVDPEHREEFYLSAREYLPFIERDDLSPDMSGIRSKLQGPGEPARDFIIRHEQDKGLVGFINLIGIESPGLTAAPAIARYVAGITKVL